MFRRFTAWLTLACYGLIAVFGQGLHGWLEHGHNDEAPATVVAVDFDSPSVGIQLTSAETGHHNHDEQSCSICQHHSLGQLFFAPPPVVAALVECGFVSLTAHDSAQPPALYSPALPRAPPVG